PQFLMYLYYFFMLSHTVLLHRFVPIHFHYLSLHDALPIWHQERRAVADTVTPLPWRERGRGRGGGPNQSAHPLPRLGSLIRAQQDRKSTRLNSSHVKISYAVFCLKKKNELISCSSFSHISY